MWNHPAAVVRRAFVLVLLSSGAVAQSSTVKPSEPENDQVLFNNACRTCHTVKKGDHRLGPSLHAIIGSKAGSTEYNNYSSALKNSDLVWTKDTLDRFIANPDQVVPGNNMKPYTGLTSAQDRAAIIAYLEKTSGK
jgi:cytochrome c